MKTYLCPQAIAMPIGLPQTFRRLFLLLILFSAFNPSHAQELVFTNPVLQNGTAGANGAEYRFSQVNSKVDALVTISGRSSSLVKLLSIDMNTSGHGKAWQPQITYNNNTTPSGTSDWWMEFSIVFVNAGTNTPAPVDSFQVTALDIDGNGDKINEWVSFYNSQSYMFESTTRLVSSNIWELLNLVNTLVGRKFEGPVANYTNIDTSATDVMVTNKFVNRNEFRIRAGGHSTGSSSAADRMYSFWFRSFNYTAPQQFHLPLVLLDFNAVLENKNVLLSWTTGKEKELSHFTIERSTNGVDFTDAGLLFANGNSDVALQYKFKDALPSTAGGMVYYRLKMVDMDGKTQHSPVRMLRLGGDKQTLQLAAYPNPVVNELRITLPSHWQKQQVQLDLYNANGQLVKSTSVKNASQTETLRLNELHTGIYILKASSGTETATQRVVKGR